jgi:hypothetical protein
MEIEITKDMILMELEEQCDECCGYGYELKSSTQMHKELVAGKYNPKICPKCQGHKTVLTTMGKEIRAYFESIPPYSSGYAKGSEESMDWSATGPEDEGDK